MADLESERPGFQSQLCHLQGSDLGNSANISVPQFPHLKNKDNDSSCRRGSVKRIHEEVCTANAPNEFVIIFSLCISRQGILGLLLVISHFSHKIRAVFPSFPVSWGHVHRSSGRGGRALLSWVLASLPDLWIHTEIYVVLVRAARYRDWFVVQRGAR